MLVLFRADVGVDVGVAFVHVLLFPSAAHLFFVGVPHFANFFFAPHSSSLGVHSVTIGLVFALLSGYISRAFPLTSHCTCSVHSIHVVLLGAIFFFTFMVPIG